MKQLIHFATEMEARSTIDLLNAKQIAPNLYAYHRGKIVLGGMGVHSTLYRLQQILEDTTQIISCGIVGALDPLIPLKSVLAVGSVTHCILREDERSMALCSKLYPPIDLNPGGMRLLTVEAPVHCKKLRTALAKRGDCLDMEGYAVAYLAKQESIPCEMIKVVSDHCVEGGWEMLQKLLPELSEILAHELEKNEQYGNIDPR